MGDRQGRAGGDVGMREQAWRGKCGWFPPSTQYIGRAAKESGFQEVGPSSCPVHDPGDLTLFPSGAERSLPPFYYLQREGRNLEAG